MSNASSSPTSADLTTDVVVVGGGNAALCAAVAAGNAGARVIVLEAAPKSEAGGNSWFTDGAIRFAFDSPEQIADLLRLPEAEAEAVIIPPYPTADYLRDLRRTAGEWGDDDLLRTLAERSFDTMRWLRDNGLPLELIYDNQSHRVGERRQFFGNLNVRVVGRGIGLIDALRRRCIELNATILYDTQGVELLMDGNRCTGVTARDGNGKTRRVFARAVVLACGGFEANADMRAAHLGEHWRAAVVRGTRHNTGEGINMALAAGAARAGNWRGGHAVSTDANSPPFGDFSLPGDIWKKHSYPYGLIVNQLGERFVDEGADIRNYTYAKYGQTILSQPGAIAYQIFDAQTEPLLRDEYRHARVARREADTPAALAELLEIDAARFVNVVSEYNRAVVAGDFNPAVLDGKHTRGLAIEKSNWALPIESPPFMAFPVVCGMTFTFGGIRADTQGRALNEAGEAVKGLYLAGEMIGGLFGANYPGGSGLMSGAVFGRIAGTSAATQQRQ